nr:hypothetical protein [Aeromonas encheleia]
MFELVCSGIDIAFLTP